MKYIILAMLGISNIANSSAEFPIGNWEAVSRSDQAIYGSFTFTQEKVYWGLASDAPPCSANYSVKIVSPENWDIKFSNKKCDYDDMNNSSHSKRLVGINLRVDASLSSKYDKVSKRAWVSTKSEGWKSNGEGMYQLYKSSFYKKIKI